MDQVRQEKIAEAIIRAQALEQVMNKELADIFQCSPLVFSYIKNQKHWGYISRNVWKQLEAWMFSGKKLKDYPRETEPVEDEEKLVLVPPPLTTIDFDKPPQINPALRVNAIKKAEERVKAGKEKAHKMKEEAREQRKKKGVPRPAPAPKPKLVTEVKIIEPKKERIAHKPGEIIAKLVFEINISVNKK